MRKERQDIFQKCLASEQTLSDVKRDSELKEIKIESLQNIIAKRELQAQGSAGPAKFAKGGKKDLTQAMEKLDREKRNLQDEVGRLALENEKLNQSIRGLKSIKEARDKQSEIQKLLETNLQTLEQRCELLEM